ncbi:uncharacterized protein LOC132199563 isoform X2 [Neocloeon triangulifer]|uniref:uncharacterized protein LOC132199563 isoform X2 n=1 Tax=Neocloeon triangulifer TaxID=2078957 RepID=UPI00286EEE56|nr:uncharacterized protein LOC132199563 isoform X2 [Neocloeon triangulifer]
MKSRTLSLVYLALISVNALVLPALAIPPPSSSRQARISSVHDASVVYGNSYDERKYDRPNKKLVRQDEADNDIASNSIQENGFSWGTMLSTVMQMLFTPALNAGPNKSDSIDTETGVSTSPWANILAVGLKILSAILGGGGASSVDGIDKVDNASPLQFINIVVNLLDALKTSFSQRSMQARSIGQKDVMSEAGVAGINLLKTFMRSVNTSNDECKKLYICEGSKSCQNDLQGGSTSLCLFSTYSASMLLEKTSGSPFSQYYEAGRRGRSGDNCYTTYETCNEIY